MILEGEHQHRSFKQHQGDPAPLYDFCECGHVKATWPSGRVMDWHKPDREGGRLATAIDNEERQKAAGL